MAAPTQSRLELLQLDLMAALATITPANGYFTTIGTVSRGQLAPLESDDMPTASLVPVQDLPDYGAGVLRRTFTFTVRVWIDVQFLADAPRVLGELVADVQRRLVVDGLRDLVAQDTRELGCQFFYSAATERLWGADVNFEVDYMTNLFDPREGV